METLIIDDDAPHGHPPPAWSAARHQLVLTETLNMPTSCTTRTRAHFYSLLTLCHPRAWSLFHSVFSNSQQSTCSVVSTVRAWSHSLLSFTLFWLSAMHELSAALAHFSFPLPLNLSKYDTDIAELPDYYDQARVRFESGTLALCRLKYGIAELPYYSALSSTVPQRYRN